jgi:hypothetical protein
MVVLVAEVFAQGAGPPVVLLRHDRYAAAVVAARVRPHIPCMTYQPPTSGPERPRSEPEIIPPDDPRGRSPFGTPFGTPWGSARGWSSGTQRVYVARIGPFGFALAALAVAIIAALVFLLVLGAFVILVPLVGLLLAGVVLASMLRGSWLRRR